MGTPTRLVGTQGKTRFFRETLGESAPGGDPELGVSWSSGSASLPETGAKHRGATPWVL